MKKNLISKQRMGRTVLTNSEGTPLTPDERRAHNRNVKLAWQAANPDKVTAFRRKGLLATLERRGSLPTKKTAAKWGFTHEELAACFASMMEHIGDKKMEREAVVPV